MIIKLYSTGNYGDIDVNFKKVELINCENIIDKLKSFTDGEVVIAKMDKNVTIEPVNMGETIDLRKRCSIKNKIYAFGSSIKKVDGTDVQNRLLKVTQSDGETYLLKNEKLVEQYTIVDKYKDLYKPKDIPKAWMRVSKNIYFKSPWGEFIFAPKGSMICIENYKAREFFVVTNTTYRSLFVEQGGKIKLDNFIKKQNLSQANKKDK